MNVWPFMGRLYDGGETSSAGCHPLTRRRNSQRRGACRRRRVNKAEMGSEDNARAAPEGAPDNVPGAAGRRKRKAGTKKKAGTKWLNRLLALGCLASLLPLWFENRGLQPAACILRALRAQRMQRGGARGIVDCIAGGKAARTQPRCLCVCARRFEYRGHKQEPWVQPHKDDPWVRLPLHAAGHARAHRTDCRVPCADSCD